MSAEVNRVLQVTMWKCGSQWVRDVLSAPEIAIFSRHPHSGLTVNMATLDCAEVPDRTYTGPVYAMSQLEWMHWSRPNDRAIVVLRDPRDALVSNMASMMYSHVPGARVDLSRRLLHSLPPNERLNFMLDSIRDWPRVYGSWLKGAPPENAMVIRYESLVADELAVFKSIVGWLGWEVPEQTLAAVVLKHSFETRSGRKPGQADAFSHHRRGKAGDWRNHFLRRHGELWEDRYPGLLQAIRYEDCGDWWRSLPETMGADADSGGDVCTTKLVEVLERKQRELLHEMEAKERVIQKLIAEREGTRLAHSGEVEQLGNLCEARRQRILWQQTELKALRRHSLSYHLGEVRRRHRYPKLGCLDQHVPIPLQKWGFPPKPRYDRNGQDWPSIAIVTPSYGQAPFIGRTIDSVLNQNYPRLEYVVQDGGSTDGTIEILKSYTSRLKQWESARDGGQSQAINRGFAKTNGEIMAWLNSDDVLLPGALAYVAAFFARNPHIDVVYGHRVVLDERGREVGRWILPAHDDSVLPYADYIPQETLFWRRSLWQKAGGRIDESFRFAMDWDLLLRFRAVGARFMCLPRFLGGFRAHEAQKTFLAIREVGQKEMDLLRRRELGRVPSREEIQKALERYMRRHIGADLSWRLRNRLGMDWA